MDSTAQSSVARAQSSSTLNRSTLGNSTLRPSASATSTATPSSFGSTAPRSFFDTSSSLASRPGASSSLSSTTRPASTLFQERQLLPQLQDHQLLQALVVLRQAQALHQELQLQLLTLLLLEQVL